MSKRQYHLIVSLFISLLLFVPAALCWSADVQGGLIWLSSQQNSDGSWGDDTTCLVRPLQATSASLEALASWDEITPVFDQGISWLTSHAPTVTEDFSWLLANTSENDPDFQGTYDSLIALADDNGWGAAAGYDAEVLDTATAVKSLHLAGGGDSSSAQRSLDFIRSSQKEDGGWGYGENDSSVYLTATVLDALSLYRATFLIDDMIDDALFYLHEQAQPDGTVGQGIYETALAFGAAVAVGDNVQASFPETPSLLTLGQQPDGSWEGEIFTTASVLKALSLDKPNVVVDSSAVSFSNPFPIEGTTVTVTVSVKNRGPEPAQDVLVQFFDGDPAETVAQIGSDVRIASLPAYGEETVLIDWDTTSRAGNHDIFVVADGLDEIAELNEDDNLQSARVVVSTVPDLVVSDGDISVTPQFPETSDTVTVSATVRNLGQAAAGSFHVELYLGHPGTGGFSLGALQVGALAGGDEAQLSWEGNFLEGRQQLYVFVDADDVVVEFDENNNEGSVAFFVYPPPSALADLTPTSLTASPVIPLSGDPVTITANVVNQGGLAADGASVELWDENAPGGRLLLGTATITTLAPSSGIDVEFAITLTEGDHLLSARVDPGSTISESNETNNISFLELSVLPAGTSQPDLVVYEHELEYPIDAFADEAVHLQLPVHNLGAVSSTPSEIAFWDGDPLSGGILLATGALGAVSPGGEDWTGANIFLTAGLHDIFVVVDGTNAVAELDETNNTVSMTLLVLEPIPDLPDLTSSAQDVSFSPLFPKESDVVTIAATVRNMGTQDAADVAVRLYDGPPDAGVLLLDTVIASIPADSWATVQTSGTFALGHHSITLVIDPEGTIPEIQEENNTITNQLSILTPPDFTVDAADITLDPTSPFSDEKITLQINAHNLGESVASNVAVAFYDGDPAQGGLPIGAPYSIYKFYGRNSVSLEKTLFLDPGVHDLYIVVDSDNTVVESDEANNVAVVSLTVQERTDLSFAFGGPTVFPTSPNEGESVDISAVVHNGGSQEIQNVSVVFYDGDPDDGGVQIGTEQIIALLGASADGLVSVTDSIGGGYREIFAVIDPADLVDESNKRNNSAWTSLAATSVLSDLAIKKGKFTYQPYSPDEGTAVTMSADIWNYGAGDLLGVEVRYLDGAPPAGLVLGSELVDIPAGGSVSTQLEAALSTGAHDVYVVVDPDDTVLESNENNNRQAARIEVAARVGFYDDSGNPDNELHLLQGTDVRLENLPDGLGEEVITASADPVVVQYAYSGLDPDAVYRVTAAVIEEPGGDRVQRVMADGALLTASFDVPDDQPAVISSILPRDLYQDGQVILSFEAISGPGAIVSQVWLVKETGRKELAIFQGLGWMDTSAGYWQSDTYVGWYGGSEAYLIPWVYAAYRANGKDADPKYQPLLDKTLSLQSPDGSWQESCVITSQALIVLLEAGIDPQSSIIRDGVAWLKRQANPDGGWGARKGYRSTSVKTGVVLAALVLSGESQTDLLVLNGVQWLKSAQNSTGYWGSYAGSADSAHIGTWPVIGLCLATSAGDSAVLTAMARYKAIANGVANFIDVWSHRLRMYYYCGGSSSEISTAISRIYSEQDSDGGWTVVYRRYSALLTNAQILEILGKFGMAGSQVQKGFTWMDQRVTSSGGYTNLLQELNVELSAWSLNTMAFAGNMSSESLLQKAERTLVQYQQSYGFWSFEFFTKDYGITFPSGIALQALAASSYNAPNEASKIDNATNFLLGAQKPNGGWPIYKGTAYASEVRSTYHILRGLLDTGTSPSSTNIVRGISWLLSNRGLDGGWGNTNDTAWSALVLLSEGFHPQQVQEAVQWLKANQNVDGGWGSLLGETSVVNETALAVIALSGAGEEGIEVARGASWLISAQNAGGDWGMMSGGGSGRVSTTAFAVWALSVARYNLGVELEVLFNKPWYYPADLVSMAVNPLNKTVDELDLTGWLQDQYGLSTDLPIFRQTDSFASEHLVPGDALPGVNNVNFVATSDDAQGTVTDTFIVRSPGGINPDLSVMTEDIAFSNEYPDSGETVTIGAMISNTSLIDALNVTVRIYHGDPADGGTQIGPDLLIDRVAGLGSSQVQFDWIADPAERQIFALVDPDNAIVEEREDNNSAVRWIYINEIISRADLQISSSDLTILPSNPYVGEPLAVSALVHNTGTVASETSLVRFYDADPIVGGVQVGPDCTVPALGVGETATVNVSIDTSGLTGRVYIYAVADPDDVQEEVSETNNQTFSFVELRAMSLPDLVIRQEGLVFSTGSPLEGEMVTVEVTVENRGQSAGGVAVSLYDGDPAAGGARIDSIQTIPGIFGQFEERTLIFPWVTTGAGGPHQLYAVVDPAGIIVETFEDNNFTSASIEVTPGNLSLAVSTTPSTFGANEEVPISVTATNNNAVPAAPLLEVTILNSAAGSLATVASEVLSLTPGESRLLSYTWNTGETLDGSYSVSARLLVDERPTSQDEDAFSITPDLSMTASMVTDKVAYGPNETTRLTWRVQSGSVNHDFVGLTATLTLADPTGATLMTDTRAIASLVRGQLISLDTFWGTGTHPPGDYPCTVQVTSGAILLAEASGMLTITDSVDPAVLLSGAITATPEVIFSGDTVNFSYDVQNVGNKDLPLVDLNIRVASVDEQMIHDELTDQAALLMGESHLAAQDLATTDYGAKDYLVVLEATIGSETASLGGTYFRIQGAPSAPSVNSPAHQSEVTTFTPTLVVNNAADPNELDVLTYDLELYADAGLTQLVVSVADVEEGQGTTSWTVPSTLTENTRYWWRCRAYDGWSSGTWMEPAAFFVNTVNDPPGPPTVDQPLDGQEVDTLQPDMVVKNAFDPDEDSLTYNFLVYSDPALVDIVTETVGVFETPGTTAWQADVPLVENTWYWWSAQADDWLDVGPWMVPASFFVNTANDAPTAPVPIAPADGSETLASVTLTVENATDPDSAVLTYLFEADTDPSFISPSLIVSMEVAEGAGTTSWAIPAVLTENTLYYWRAKAYDGQAESPWSTVFAFFVNEVNESPTTPVLANPSDGGEVTFLQPELVVHNASDPDQDVLTYDFEIYADDTMTTLVTAVAGITEGEGGQTAWMVDLLLTENTWYWWRCRAYDGELVSGWMVGASFFVNTANDAPSAPLLVYPDDGGSVEVLQPELVVTNASDPDSDVLTYHFEIYSDTGMTTLVSSVNDLTEGPDTTSWTVTPELEDDTSFWWRARAFDGERYGPWMETATFTVHLPITSITGTIDFDPDTLNLGSKGKWVTVYIELPPGYDTGSIDPATVILQETVPAELKPAGLGDEDHDGIPDFKVKFSRAAVEAILPVGEEVVVYVTGMAGETAFEGIDIIRVINP